MLQTRFVPFPLVAVIHRVPQIQGGVSLELAVFQLLGWDIITPRLVEELNSILQQQPEVDQQVQEQWTQENDELNAPRQRITKNGTIDRRYKQNNQKRKRSVPIGELSGRLEVLQIDVADLYAFLRVYTEMGLNRLFATSDYWKTG